MKNLILVVNAGSSSLKFCVFQSEPDNGLAIGARGQIDGLGRAPKLVVKNASGQPIVQQSLDSTVGDSRAAISVMNDWLQTHFHGQSIAGVGHRVVHGGRRFLGPVLVTPDALSELRALSPLAPLHQPDNLDAIEWFMGRMPSAPQVACFDTAFHRGRPAVASVVALPRELCQAGIERYGFHGLSYEHIASVLPEIAPEVSEGRVIVAHLGSGASLCALRQRSSVDTTMGFSTLDGLCMGTRPGSLDPGVVLYLLQSMGLSIQQVEDLLYRQSGLLGISGISSDMRDLLVREEHAARLAVEYFVYRITKEVGAMAAAMGGVDAIVFTGGIGENSSEIRSRACLASSWLGLELDETANIIHGPRISTATSRVSAWVIPANEELMIARHTRRLLEF